VQHLPPAVGDAGLLERVRRVGANWGVVGLAGLMALAGLISIGLAAVRDEPDRPASGSP
jgi:hypothetical protein